MEIRLTKKPNNKKFPNNNCIKTKREIYWKINLSSYFIDCGFKNFGATDKEEILLYKYIYIYNLLKI